MKRKNIQISILLLILFILINSYTGFVSNMIASKALNLEKPSLCKIILSDDKREHCIVNIAMTINDSDLCESLTSETDKVKDPCYSEIAENKLDYTLCEKINNEWMKNNCFDYIAKSTNNKYLCGKINDESKKEECIKIISEFEPGYCERLLDYERNLCFARRATWLSNPDDCRNITEDRGDTRDNCFRNIEISTNDKELCKSITDQRVKESCLSSLSK